MSDISRTIDQLIRDEDPRTRLFALDLLMRNPHHFAPKELIDRLKNATQDTVPSVSEKAQGALASLLTREFPDQQAIRDLGITSKNLRKVSADVELELPVRERAAPVLEPVMRKIAEMARKPAHPCAPQALEVIGKSKNLAYSGILIKATQQPQLRDAAYEALWHFRVPQGITLAENLLAHAESDVEVSMTAEVLGCLAQEEGVSLLTRMVQHSSEVVREAAAAALGKIVCPASEPPLLKLLDDRAEPVLLAAVAALGKVGRAHAVEALAARFDRFTDLKVLSRCLSTFAQLQHPRFLPFVLKSLSHENTRVRANALEALARFHLERDEALRLVAPFLDDRSNRIKANAIVALYSHDHERANAALKALLKSRKGTERASAYWAMGEVQDPDAMEPFTAALAAEQDRSILATGVAVLDRLSNPRLKRGIHRLLFHQSPTVKVPAVLTFARLAGAAGIKELDSLYDVVDSEVVKSAILTALGQICEPGNIGPITRRLREPHERIVANAIEALDRVGSLENSTLLESFLSHPVPRVRANAVVALFRVGQFHSIETLLDLISRPDEAAQRSALYAMGQIQSSLDWQELKTRPLLLTPLTQDAPPIPERPRESMGEIAMPRPTTTIRTVADETSEEESRVAAAFVALAESRTDDARGHLRFVLDRNPGHELALYLLQKLDAASKKAPAIPPGVLDASSFLPLLAEELKRAKEEQDVSRLLTSYFRIFDRQLALMSRFVAVGREMLAKGAGARAMEVVKFIVTQVQWTVDLDLRLAQIFVDRQEWPVAYEHLLRAYAVSGGDPSVGVTLCSVAMKLRKREFARILVTSILSSTVVDARIRNGALAVAQALAGQET